jgi:hypothetical protein
MFKSNSVQFTKQLEAYFPKWKKDFAKRLDTAARYSHKQLMSKTPVHEGTTVRNYILTMNAPSGAVYSPIESGPIGQTNNMPLGLEPRRGANEKAAEGSLTNLKIDPNKPFVKIFISNNTDSVAGLEVGELPGAPFKSRSPSGMFGITMEQLLSKLNSGSL